MTDYPLERGPRTVKVHEAKTTLSRLIALVLDGERVIIARDDVPVVELIAMRPMAQGPRRFGALRGAVYFTPDFFAPLPSDELDAWGS
jgi:antitoxin (DNA-binding transcriptional repressor) of toxin-antitoxin stability system